MEPEADDGWVNKTFVVLVQDIGGLSSDSILSTHPKFQYRSGGPFLLERS